MTTKLDKQWADDTITRVEAMAREIERLEGILGRIEMFLDPHPSPGGDTEWLVKNAFGNMQAEIDRLKNLEAK